MTSPPVGAGPVTVRPAAAADLDAIRSIEEAYGNLHPWPARPDFLDHEFEAGRIVVAQRLPELVGFAGVFDYSELTYLADLFVRPDLLGQGIGRALLAVILQGRESWATLASSDPRAVPLYVRFGVQPVMRALYLSGGVEAARRLPSLPSRPRVASPDADLDELVDLDAVTSGRRRPLEHRFLLSLPGTVALVHGSGDRPSAYAYVRTVLPEGQPQPEAFIGPCGGESEQDFAFITRAAITQAVEMGCDGIHLSVFERHPDLSALLKAGFHGDDVDTFMATDADLLDGRLYAPNPEFG
jgi:GNAT superfamily N-acetyltransferase